MCGEKFLPSLGFSSSPSVGVHAHAHVGEDEELGEDVVEVGDAKLLGQCDLLWNIREASIQYRVIRLGILQWVHKYPAQLLPRL